MQCYSRSGHQRPHHWYQPSPQFDAAVEYHMRYVIMRRVQGHIASYKNNSQMFVCNRQELLPNLLQVQWFCSKYEKLVGILLLYMEKWRTIFTTWLVGVFCWPPLQLRELQCGVPRIHITGLISYSWGGTPLRSYVGPTKCHGYKHPKHATTTTFKQNIGHTFQDIQ